MAKKHAGARTSTLYQPAAPAPQIVVHVQRDGEARSERLPLALQPDDRIVGVEVVPPSAAAWSIAAEEHALPRAGTGLRSGDGTRSGALPAHRQEQVTPQGIVTQPEEEETVATAARRPRGALPEPPLGLVAQGLREAAALLRARAGAAYGAGYDRVAEELRHAGDALEQRVAQAARDTSPPRDD